MILHRDARSDLRAFKIAEIFDQFGLRVISIHQDNHGLWRVWAQGDDVDTHALDQLIDPPEGDDENNS